MAAAAVLVLAGAGLSLQAATINADFTDGTTTTLSDGYTGVAGAGWLGAWTPALAGATLNNTVTSTSPLEGGGNHLNISMAAGTAAGSYSASVGRKFDATQVSPTAPYTLSFKVRLNTAMANQSDAISIFGDVGTGYPATTGSNNTWLISGYNNNGSPIWTFYDGNRAGGSVRVLTDLPLTVGTVYNFVVNVDPATRSWTVAVDNGAYLYKSGVLGFRNAAPTTSGNTLIFGGTVRDTTGTLGYSVDAIGISSGVGAIPSSALRRIDVGLAPTWRFATDPNNLGTGTAAWYGDTFNDSAWQILRAGQSWEDQGVNYAGYGWYRQKIDIPASSAGVPIRLELAPIFGDDDVYFNGVRVGGIRSNYKYQNLLDRQYTIPASLVRYGQSNTIAVRCWGGNFGSSSLNSGLVAGSYKAVLDPYRVMARDTGGQEKPVEIYDMSPGQQGRAFELVFRYPQSLMISSTANLTCTLTNFYNASLQAAVTVPVAVGVDGIVRGVIPVSVASSQAIYLGGRFKATLSLKDGVSGTVLSSGTVPVDYLTFAQRDALQLSALSTTFESTPYGSLKLIDSIDCSTSLATEIHPYMQSAFGNHDQDYCTPGQKITIPVNTILGKPAREPGYGWFAYRIGRGVLTAGKTYLLRIEYPEDKPRYCPIEVQAGRNYMDIGWKNGLSSTDPYDNWPLSGTWQFYDSIVALGDESVATGGTGDGDSANGFWVYVMNKVKPGAYFSLYQGGPAVATMKLYEISPTANAPTITLPPAALPQRVLMFDWERQAEQTPADLVNYAKLMGYSTISPIMMKWALANYGEPTNGYYSINVDDQGYWVQNTANPAVPVLPGTPTVHQQYLDATRTLGLDYVPRFEYGGSSNLPATARAINKNGTTALPNRFSPAWSANLLDPATFTDLQYLLDRLIKPYTATNPQLKGALWRVREDRMQISYGRSDVTLFGAETGTTLPSGYSDAQLAAWASSGTVGANYSTWWQQKRADFHQQVVSLLKSYRPDMTLYYYNWDPDKFSMMAPDMNAASFTKTTAGYTADRTARAGYTEAQYINIMNTGDFSASLNGYSNRPDYALRPSLYSAIPGMQLFAPVNYLCYADKPGYINYFQTADGLAVSNIVSYDEIAMRQANPKYEGSMITPGGAPFSMALELLSYYHGDARTLTYTAYTYGRGFVDAHRRFAQAFRALPAVPATLVTGTPTDVAARLYPTASNGTYVGIAYKGYTSGSFNVDLPGTWSAGMVVTNLVTNQVIPTVLVSGKLRVPVASGPMELHAFCVTSPMPAPVISSAGTAAGTVGPPFSYTIIASNSPASYGATGLPAGLSLNTSTGVISGTPAGAGTSTVTLSATNAGGTGTKPLTLTVSAASVSVVANFTNGNTTTQADGYAGMAGGGWLGPWTTAVAGSTFSNTVLATDPMGGGGNRLDVNLTAGTAAQNYPGAVGRKFDPAVISTTAPHTIIFKIRLDTAMTIQSDGLSLFGDVGSGYAWSTGPGNTWLITGYYNSGSPIWRVNNGDRAGGSTAVNTTMPLVVGTVYTITVQIDPATQSWTVNISDGTNPSYQSGTLGFRNAAVSGAGNSVFFGGNVRNTTGTLGYSLDTLSITSP